MLLGFLHLFIEGITFENTAHSISLEKMNIIRRATISLLRYLKQLNLFNTYSADERQIQHELLPSRIYLVLFPTILAILVIYSAQKELYYTVQVNNPTLDTYQRLLVSYPNTLLCPCSQLSIPYSSFATLMLRFHPVCSSDFVSNPWLTYLYRENASFYASLDIRSVGNAQFQLLRTLCESSKQAIDNAFESTFSSAALVNDRGMLLESELVRVQVEVFAKDFLDSIASEERRRRTLFATFFDRNFLVSGLETSAIPFIDSTFNLKMKIPIYLPGEIITGIGMPTFTCTCVGTYECETPLGICNTDCELNYSSTVTISLLNVRIATVDGFQSGCLPINSLLLSTLECYNNQSCLNNFMAYLPSVNTSFHILNSSVLNQSTSTTPIGTLTDNLMIEQWSREMNYTRYFAACRPLLCSYTYTEKFSILYIITTVIGLIGGLTTILRVLCPQLTNIFYRIQKHILLDEVNRPSSPLLSDKRHDIS
jgi:hypothetical protein